MYGSTNNQYPYSYHFLRPRRKWTYLHPTPPPSTSGGIPRLLVFGAACSIEGDSHCWRALQRNAPTRLPMQWM